MEIKFYATCKQNNGNGTSVDIYLNTGRVIATYDFPAYSYRGAEAEVQAADRFAEDIAVVIDRLRQEEGAFG